MQGRVFGSILVSTHEIPVAPLPPAVTAQNVSRHRQMSRGRIASDENQCVDEPLVCVPVWEDREAGSTSGTHRRGETVLTPMKGINF